MNWRLEVPYMGDGERIRNLIPSHAVWVYSPPGLLLGVGRIFYDSSQRERNSVPFFDQFFMKHSVKHFTHVASFYLHLKPLRWPQAGIRVSTEEKPEDEKSKGSVASHHLNGVGTTWELRLQLALSRTLGKPEQMGLCCVHPKASLQRHHQKIKSAKRDVAPKLPVYVKHLRGWQCPEDGSDNVQKAADLPCGCQGVFLKHTSAWSLSPLHSGGTSSQCGTACHSDHWARDTEHLNHGHPSCDVLECEIHNALQWFNHNKKECRLSASCQEMASTCSMHGAGRRSQCSGAAQRDGVGRAVGRFRMGDTCVPMADSCRCMAKTTTIL